MDKHLTHDEVVQNQIDEIMDWVDFHKIQRVMEFLEWKWADVDGTGIPNVAQLRSQARRLLKEAVQRKWDVGTGGFTATYTRGNDETNPGELGWVRLGLSFNVENYLLDGETYRKEL